MADAAALRSMVGELVNDVGVWAGVWRDGKMACALTDDGKTIGSYKKFRVVVDPYLICMSVTTSDNRLSSST